ncbi:UNVERIFIED_CONTAM: Hid1 [Trichonephila clavipes]
MLKDSKISGNSNLVYTIIRKRNVFHSLANLPTDHSTIQKSLSKRNKLVPSTSTMSLNSCTSGMNNQSMEGSTPARPAEKGTLNASLAATPCIDKMTERERAHPPSVPTSPTETSPPSLEEHTKETASETIQQTSCLEPEGQEMITNAGTTKPETASKEKMTPPLSPTLSVDSSSSEAASSITNSFHRTRASSAASSVTGAPNQWVPTSDWVISWKQKLPLQTIMRLLQVLVPQVEKICIDK